MRPRLDYPTFRRLAPAIDAGLLASGRDAEAAGLEPRLVELVKVRASQLNGCAHCIHVHVAKAIAAGERYERLHLLGAWREAPLFDARERAALEWCEALTLVTEGHVPDAVHAAVRERFSEAELAGLTSAIVAINAWNRISIAYRFLPPVGGSRTG
jgi:AhpD family alkylhydroperoxidase